RYLPVATQIEPLLLDAAALAAYRLAVDGKAQTLLAASHGSEREAALAEVVRRYRLSTAGEAAALELAGRLLDRHDFVGAARLLQRTLALLGEPSTATPQLRLRLAVALAHLGESAAA